MVPRADGEEIAPGAPLAGALVETAGSNLPSDVADLPKVLGELIGKASCDVPLDLRLLGFHQDAERGLLGVGLCELVGGELVGEQNLVRLVGAGRGVEVDSRSPLAHQRQPHVAESSSSLALSLGP